MAFRQPQQRPPALRHASFSQPTPAPEVVTPTAVRKRQLEEEAQEWVLFSPTVDDQVSTTASHTSQTPRTANLSHISDLDSLETGLRSDQYAVDDATCQGTDLDDDEAGELDSLDDGLHAFQSPSSPYLDHSGGTVLPMHDGLGTFPSTYAYGTTEGMQEHMWQFERYNPHRRTPQRRRSSVQKRIDSLEDDEEHAQLDKHEERRLRIEKWRLEQSRAVLEEIERETRRRQRRMSLVSAQSSALPPTARLVQPEAQPIPNPGATPVEDGEAPESFWQRITRRLIKDLMGLDETTLSVIFGECLASDLDSTPTQPSPLSSNAIAATHSDMTWEQRLLDRIARELGLLADRLSEHEGAFNTYKEQSSRQEQQQPSEARARQQRIPNSSLQSLPTLPLDNLSTTDDLFSPTFPRTKATVLPPADTSLWGIEEEPPLNPSTVRPTAPDKPRHDKEYWERDLDVGVIFRYLRNRFTSPNPSTTLAGEATQAIPPAAATGPLPQGWASDPTASALGTSPESFRRVDMIRKNHPLVSHAATVSATRRRESMLLRRQHQFLSHRRVGSSSCASQSTKRTRSGGSRRYWDFPNGGGGSAAGGSAVSVTSGGYEGMMGSWGEV